MKDIIKNNSKFIIVMLLIIVLGITGVTVAIKVGNFNPIAINTTTGNISATISYDSSVNSSTVTSTGKMLPIEDSLVTGTSVTDARVLKVKFTVTGKSTNPANSIYDISLRNITMDDALKDSNVKWRLYKNNTLLSSGDFSPTFDVMENNRMVLTTTQQDLTTTASTYVFLMWISESCAGDIANCTNSDNQFKYVGKSFSFNIKLETATKTKKNLTRKTSAAGTITTLYNNATKTPVTNNSITYQYDTKNSLMKDVGGNIRYYGASPNNYIYFNCSDYSNQSSSTCETWRIIGVFDGKIKLIRGSQIGTYAWDNKDTTTGAENNYGKNDWTDARLMKLLNPGYESEATGGSLYYNSGSGNCYAWYSNATTTCDFTSTGIKNDITRNLISDTTYYLGGHNSSSVYPNEIYEKERGTTVYSGRPTSWIGKIAIAYPSDYGYAADLGKCTKQLGSYNDTTCTSNNWMNTIIAPNNGWLLTPSSGNERYVWRVYSPVDVYYNIYAYIASGVAPVLYLGSELSVKAGIGSSSDPYQISV